MRVLFATGSPRDYMAPPRLGDEQVNCGPDWPDERGGDGRIRSLATPQGVYDLAAVAAKLPPDQAPDLVVCLVDASWRNVPRNLQAFRCPRVLLVADTHHLASPLRGMLQYANSEPFDRLVLLYDRHHAAVFEAAGFRNVYWFPGLTFPHRDALVRAARRNGARKPHLVFVGQAAAHHPRRRRMLDAVAAARLPLAQQMVTQAEALSAYGASVLALNCSLNGDLNLRVFEILASGSALLTDRLAPASGLARLLEEGREVITYGSAAELVERAKAALEDRVATTAIGAAGMRWFDQNFSAAHRWKMFQELAFDGRAAPMFVLEPSPPGRRLFGGQLARLAEALPVYEVVQEAHRVQENILMVVDATVPSELLELYATLPRVFVLPQGNQGPVDFAVFGRDEPVPSAETAWCWNAAPADLPALASRLQRVGLTAVNPDIPFFHRSAPTDAAVAPTTDSGDRPVGGVRPPRGRELRREGLLLLARVAARAGDAALRQECMAAVERLA